jgi:hypothetical protein
MKSRTTPSDDLRRQNAKAIKKMRRGTEKSAALSFLIRTGELTAGQALRIKCGMVNESQCFDCGRGARGEAVDLREFKDVIHLCQPCATRRGYKWAEGTQTKAARKRARLNSKP